MPDGMERISRVAAPWLGACPACGAPGTGAGEYRNCADCCSIWVPARRDYRYDDEYPAFRGHHDDAIAACKIKTFEHWQRHLGMPLAGKNALEVGFGGGATLAWMREQGATVSGVEPVAANRAAAASLGVPAGRLAASLDELPGDRFDLVFYLDSFEHETEPARHLERLNRLTAPGAKALLVLPIADCLSRRIMGRWWPHDIRDHWVFYSTGGLAQLWERHGWALETMFHPSKYISGLTIARHVELKTRVPLPAAALRSTAIWLYFGERGLVFRKTAG